MIPKRLRPGPIAWAFIISAVVTAAAGLVFLTKEVWLLEANEMGDFFAGFAGTLAFVWIIATIFLQRDELSLQRMEVRRLADESRAQTGALRISAQTDFYSNWDAYVPQLLTDVWPDLRDAAERLHEDVAAFGVKSFHALDEFTIDGQPIEVRKLHDIEFDSAKGSFFYEENNRYLLLEIQFQLVADLNLAGEVEKFYIKETSARKKSNLCVPSFILDGYREKIHKSRNFGHLTQLVRLGASIDLIEFLAEYTYSDQLKVIDRKLSYSSRSNFVATQDMLMQNLVGQVIKSECQ